MDGRPTTEAGRAAWAAILAEPGRTLLALDFDGTLAPIVDDPEQAYADPGVVRSLRGLTGRLNRIAIITGRPVRSAVRLGRLDDVGGLGGLVVLGQYGVERWDAAADRYDIPPDPPAIAAVVAELPALLAGLGLREARLEHKGRAVGVHTRGLPDPASAFRRLAQPIHALADRYDLQAEPGKYVWEIRAKGVDKGDALRAVVAESRASAVIYAGDDLGDLPAFRAVGRLREEGVPGLLVCSASEEEEALRDVADIVVDGPAGVAEWLDGLATALEDGS